MPIYDQKASALIEELKAASNIEGEAIKALNSYLQSGGNNREMMKRLTERMETAHNSKMIIYQKLQQFRIDTQDIQ